MIKWKKLCSIVLSLTVPFVLSSKMVKNEGVIIIISNFFFFPFRNVRKRGHLFLLSLTNPLFVCT